MMWDLYVKWTILIACSINARNGFTIYIEYSYDCDWYARHNHNFLSARASGLYENVSDENGSERWPSEHYTTVMLTQLKKGTLRSSAYLFTRATRRASLARRTERSGSEDIPATAKSDALYAVQIL